MANAVPANNPHAAAAPPAIPGPAFIPNPVVHILLPPVAAYNERQIHEILTHNPDKNASWNQFYTAMYKVAYATTMAAFIAMVAATVVLVAAQAGLASLLTFSASLLSAYLIVKTKNLLNMHEKKVERENGIAKQYVILNDPAKREALIQRIAHPQIHPQLREERNRAILQNGLARIANFHEERRLINVKYGEIELQLLQLENQENPPQAKILQKRVQLLNLDDSFRLTKIHEAFVILILTNPAIRQNLDQLITLRQDIKLLESNRPRRWDWMIEQIVGQQFNDAQRTAFLTLKNNRTTVSAEAIDRSDPNQLAAMLAGALPQ